MNKSTMGTCNARDAVDIEQAYISNTALNATDIGAVKFRN
jgi:hypothetical protein